MFDTTDSLTRAAACLTHADGRVRYVYQNGAGPTVSLERPSGEHVEVHRDPDLPWVVFGTNVRPCPHIHPSAVFGFVYTNESGRWARDWTARQFTVFDREGEGRLFAIANDSPAVWNGQVIQMSKGFVVRSVGTYEIGGELFTLLESADGDEFLVVGDAWRNGHDD